MAVKLNIYILVTRERNIYSKHTKTYILTTTQKPGNTQNHNNKRTIMASTEHKIYLNYNNKT